MLVYYKTQIIFIRFKKDLNEIWQKKTQGAIIRSSTNWVEVGEKPSKYFLNLEKHNYNKKCIFRLYNEEGALITDPNEILRMQADLYQKLYTTNSRGEVDWEFLREIPVIKLDEVDRMNLDKVLDIDELTIAVKQLKHNKAPGTDGLPAEFYVKFWEKIKCTLYYAYQEAFNSQLHITACRGILSLLERLIVTYYG